MGQNRQKNSFVGTERGIWRNYTYFCINSPALARWYLCVWTIYSLCIWFCAYVWKAPRGCLFRLLLFIAFYGTIWRMSSNFFFDWICSFLYSLPYPSFLFSAIMPNISDDAFIYHPHALHFLPLSLTQSPSSSSHSVFFFSVISEIVFFSLLAACLCLWRRRNELTMKRKAKELEKAR